MPFASFDAVVASWPVSGRWQEPALRRARLVARGRTLRDGLESAAYSVPGLVFVSIRKGTMRYGPPRVGPPTGAAGASLAQRAAAPSAP